MADLDRIMLVLDRGSEQGLFDRAALAVGGTRANVPGRRCDDLVVRDLAVLDFDPVAQSATDRFGGTPPLAVPFSRLDVPLVVQAELAQDTLRLAIEDAQFVHPREVSQHDRGTAHLAVHVEHETI